MTQEDKAKAYDKLIIDIKRIMFNHEGGNLYNLLKQQDKQELSISAYTSNKSINKFADDYSHMIWEKLIDKFNKIDNYSIGCNDVSDIVLNAIINTYNWLKKQDEQKPIDKIKLKPEGKSALEGINEEKVDNANKIGTNNIKPKFNIGNWIINKVNNSVYQIIGYENNIYRIKKPDCVYYELLCDIDETYRLWTIKDAKPGDVVVTRYGNIFIFKSIKGYSVYDYCGLYYGQLITNSSLVDNYLLDYTPAVKEQRDLLIETLNKAGYTFDFDKKEVKKINEVKPKFHKDSYISRNGHNPVFIKNINGDNYEIELFDGTKVYSSIDYIDKHYHLWNIFDAKNGDIIKHNTHTFMFFGIKQNIVQGLNIFVREKICEWGDSNTDKYTPATKEEADAFKKKMVDAGYTYESLIFKVLNYGR